MSDEMYVEWVSVCEWAVYCQQQQEARSYETEPEETASSWGYEVLYATQDHTATSPESEAICRQHSRQTSKQTNWQTLGSKLILLNCIITIGTNLTLLIDNNHQLHHGASITS